LGRKNARQQCRADANACKKRRENDTETIVHRGKRIRMEKEFF